MSKTIFITLFPALALCVCLSQAVGQTTPAKATGKPTTPEVEKKQSSAWEIKANAENLPCEGCNTREPAGVYTSNKNVATIFGPPDGKGDPVEYHVFTQSSQRGEWAFETGGRISQPGQKVTVKYYKPVQLMVVIYTGTPTANMVEFSNIKVAAPTRPANEPCRDCTCRECLYPVPTKVYTTNDNNVTLTRISDTKKTVQYQVFTQNSNKAWSAQKANVINAKGEKASNCYGKPAQTLVIVYGETPQDVEITSAQVPCKQD
ncbi:MAG: hypothetical protein JNJ57_04945 [Saprospiraceae bacterium]|nr:hypothetical protein [Saprospiraceae bacterium]